MDFKAELQSLRQAGLYRRLRRMDSVSARTVVVEGSEMLMCASNNYLGLAGDQRVLEAAQSALVRFGSGSGGSRLTTGNTALHERLEQALAQFKGTEAALLFNTGYMANVAALTALVGQGDLILSDQLNHASLIDGARLSRADVQVYRHVDMQDLQDKLQAAQGRYRRILIATDGVFSMDGDLAPLPQICDLAERHGALVMVDDAHATGVLGPKGAGTADHFDCVKRVAVQMGTLSKALGAEGGYIAGARELIELLLNKARPFIFSTAQSPATVGAALCALQIVQAEPNCRAHLLQMAVALRERLVEAGFTVLPSETPILGVVIGEAEAALLFARELEAQGVFAPAIRPPTVPAGSSRIRLTLTALHTMQDVEFIAAAFVAVREKLSFEPEEGAACPCSSPQQTPVSAKR